MKEDNVKSKSTGTHLSDNDDSVLSFINLSTVFLSTEG